MNEMTFSKEHSMFSSTFDECPLPTQMYLCDTCSAVMTPVTSRHMGDNSNVQGPVKVALQCFVLATWVRRSWSSSRVSVVTDQERRSHWRA